MEFINENNYENDSNNSSSTNSLNTLKFTIPSIPDTYTFSRKCYDEDMLSSIISKADFDKIINKASFVFGDCLAQKKQNDKFEEAFSVKITRPVSLFFIVLFVLFFYLTQNYFENLITFLISILFLLGGIGLTIYEGLRSFCKKNRKYYTLQEIIAKNMIEYFDEINQKLSEDKKNLFFEFLPDDQNIICNIIQDDVIHDFKSSKSDSDNISFNNSSSFSNKSKSNISGNNKINDLQVLKLKNNESMSDRESKKIDLVSDSNKSKEKKSDDKKVMTKDYGVENIKTEEPMINNNDLEDNKIIRPRKKENMRKKTSKRDSTLHNSLI